MCLSFFLENFWVFEAGFLCLRALAVLQLPLQIKLASDSQRSFCLCLLSAVIKGVCHHYLVNAFS